MSEREVSTQRIAALVSEKKPGTLNSRPRNDERTLGRG